MPARVKVGDREPARAAGIDRRFEMDDDAFCAVIVWLHTGWRRSDKTARQGAYYLIRREAEERGLSSFVQGVIRQAQSIERDKAKKTRAIELDEG